MPKCNNIQLSMIYVIFSSCLTKQIDHKERPLYLFSKAITILLLSAQIVTIVVTVYMWSCQTRRLVTHSFA